jgi:tRNA uridine 5-carbamoylmethylation protein Kti12
MKTYESKLIILRGNSASGKSTVAKQLRDSSSRKIAIVEQDYLRRFILKEKETEGTDNIGLIYQTVIYALSRGYDVILDGILYFPRYGKMLQKLVKRCPDNYIYYFNVSFEETLKRHKTKPVAQAYGEKEMRDWYNHMDVTDFKNEIIVPESASPESTVRHIVKDTGI